MEGRRDPIEMSRYTSAGGEIRADGRDAAGGDSFGLGSGCCPSGDLVLVFDGGQPAQ